MTPPMTPPLPSDTLPKSFLGLLPANIAHDESIIEGLTAALDTHLIHRDDLLGVTHFFDARHLPCPLPLLKTKIALKEVMTGHALYLLATDKNSQTDLVAYCQKNTLSVQTWVYGQTETIFHFLLTKNP